MANGRRIFEASGEIKITVTGGWVGILLCFILCQNPYNKRFGDHVSPMYGLEFPMIWAMVFKVVCTKKEHIYLQNTYVCVCFLAILLATMRARVSWAKRAQERKLKVAKLSENIFEYMHSSGQIENFEVTGEMFPRGHLRSKSVQQLCFLNEFGPRSFLPSTCALAIKRMLTSHSLQPVRRCSETLDAYCLRQARRLQTIAQGFKAASRQKKYRERKAAKGKVIAKAMDFADTLPMDPDAP